MASSMLPWPVLMMTSVSGAVFLMWSMTSQPLRPGIRRSTMATSKDCLSSAAMAAAPSSQIVASCPMRGSSIFITSRMGGSSSTNRTRNLLTGTEFKQPSPWCLSGRIRSAAPSCGAG